MANKTAKTRSVDLGAAQAEYENSNRDWQASERALARAQEDRDQKRAKALAADAALQDAVRTVRG
jgi:hypothetical protein